MSDSFRLLTFETSDIFDEEAKKKVFNIQMFGVNEQGQTACIHVKEYAPFFYVKVGDDWQENEKIQFVEQIAMEIGEQYAAAILSTQLVQRKKLYGFDGGKQYNFVQFNFRNEAAMKKVKGLWYTKAEGDYRLNPDGYCFTIDGEEGEEKIYKTILYEAQIPPLLRLFHIKEISPSGWIDLPRNKTITLKHKTTSCDKEFSIHYNDIIPLPKKESIVPYKICSFDIEASSSHGDFPLPVKNYKKLATNMVDVCAEADNYAPDFIQAIVRAAFGFRPMDNVDLVYPIKPVSKELVDSQFQEWIKIKPANYATEHVVLDLGLTDIKYQHSEEDAGEAGADAGEAGTEEAGAAGEASSGCTGKPSRRD